MAKQGGRGEGTWLSECAMAQTKISSSNFEDDSGYIYTPYKSKWQRFSEVKDKKQADFSFFPFATDDFYLSYDAFVDKNTFNFESALEAMRSRFANENILNSIRK